MKPFVLVNGCFDKFHRGHREFLEFAAAYASSVGCRLVVLVNDDESIRKIKGPTRPFNNFEERTRVLRLFGYDTYPSNGDVEYAVRKLDPAMVIRGHDQVAEPFLKRWIRAPKFGDISTTKLCASS